MIICHKWGSTNIYWNSSNWKWSECQIALELAEQFRVGIDPDKFYKEEETFWIKDTEKRKCLIKLICKIKGKIYDEEKEVKDIKINVEDIQLVVQNVLGIELKIKE